MTCNASVLYNWNFIKFGDPWPMIHVVQPMNLYLLTQNIRWAFLIIFVFESLEAFVLTVCNGTYCWWNGGTLTCDSYVADNMLGDIIQGIGGIFLGVLLRTVLNSPNWAISLREAVLTGSTGLFFKRLFFAALILTSPVLATLESVDGLNFGVALYGGTVCAVIMLFAFWNQTKDERQRFWTDSKGLYEKDLYWSYYSAWLLVAGALIFGGWYIPYPSTYGRVWTVWLCIWLVMVMVGANSERWYELIDLHTLGLYSIVSKSETSRFLNAQRRYRKTDT